MTAAVNYFHTNILPWTVIPDEDRRLRRFVTVALVFYVVVAVVMTVVTIPKRERVTVQEIPPQLAKLILEREKPKPPPPPVEKKEEEKPKPKEEKKEEKKPEKKPEEKKKEEKPPEPKPEPEKPKVDIEAARKKASKTGLLAAMDDLADLRDTRPPDLGKNIAVTRSAAAKPTAASEPQLITSNTRGSGGVDTSSLARASRRTSGGELQGRNTEAVESPVEAQAKVEKDLSSSRGGRISPRTNEEVTLVFERYKSALTQLHARALRSDPNAKGKVTLELTIEPDGTVTHCKVVSSDFDAPDFLSKVVARVKTFDFGEKKVERVTITYPLEFIPLS